MSTSQRKKTLISVDPRAVTERTVVMPGTRRMASSIGRVTVTSLDVGRRDSVVDQDDDAGEIGLREDRDRQLEDEDQAGQRKGEHDENHRAAMRFHKVGNLGIHFPASEIFTSVPSGSP